MSGSTMETTRHGLHAIAEYVLAGPQYAQVGDIRLRVEGAGFQTWSGGLRVEADALVTGEGARLALVGSSASLAAAAGMSARDLRDVYVDGPALDLDAPLLIDTAAAAEILTAYQRGAEALARLAPQEPAVLWPEHFDVGVTLDEVNYGVSPGDVDHGEPYAYVGPWQRRTGAFWNAPFGAVRWMRDLVTADDVLAFFVDGRSRAAADPT